MLVFFRVSDKIALVSNISTLTHPCVSENFMKILEDWGWALAKNLRVQCRSGDRKHTCLYLYPPQRS